MPKRYGEPHLEITARGANELQETVSYLGTNLVGDLG
jgi:hypothetical protein